MNGIKCCEVIRQLSVCRRVIKTVKKRAKRYQWKSMRNMAKELYISDRSLRRIVKPWKIQRRQLPPKCPKAKRLVSEKKIFEEMERAADKICVLSDDEKFFTVESVVEYQTDRAYATSSGNIPEVIWTHFMQQNLTRVMVLCCFNGSKSTLVVIERRCKGLHANVGSGCVVLVASQIWKSLSYTHGKFETEFEKGFLDKLFFPPSTPSINSIDIVI